MIGGLLGLVFGLIALLVFIFWIWMLIDCIKNPRLIGNQKIIWVLVVFFLYGLGALIYYFAGRNPSA